jgi:hypothetical protein
MAKKEWKVTKVKYCDHVGHEVALENEVVYPADHLPDQPARVVARRCSNAMECNQFDKPVCTWCGTNPDHDPQ